MSKLEAEAREAATDVAAPGEPKLALIDFGMTAHLPQRLRDNIVRLLMGIAENHGEQAAETLIEMGEAVDSFDRKTYETEIAGIIAQHVDQSVGDMPAGAVLFRMIDAGYKKGLKLPAELTLDEEDRKQDLYGARAGRVAGGERAGDAELAQTRDGGVLDRGRAGGVYGPGDPDQRSEAERVGLSRD